MNHQVYLLLGSNIDPVHNIQKALRLLCDCCSLVKTSSVWESEAYGNAGSPNFLNLVALIITTKSLLEIKSGIIEPIEQTLGRVRTGDKNAPRTIDLDIIVFDEEIVDATLWKRDFIALPLAELLPDLLHPTTQDKLNNVAQDILVHTTAKIRTDVNLSECG